MKNRLRTLRCIPIIIVISFAFVVLAADKPAVPTLVNTVDLGTFTAVIYTQGDHTFCVSVVGKSEGASAAGKCFLEAREIVLSDPLEHTSGRIYAFTVDLIGRPDANCSISLPPSSPSNTGGAAVYCAEAF